MGQIRTEGRLWIRFFEGRNRFRFFPVFPVFLRGSSSDPIFSGGSGPDQVNLCLDVKLRKVGGGGGG